MDWNLSLLLKNPLFKDMDEKELSALLRCLKASKKTYEKNQAIYRSGDSQYQMGILLKGRIHITKEDYKGYSVLVSTLLEGQLFAETFVYAQLPTIPVTVTATQSTSILFLDYESMLKTCSNSCPTHHKLIQNMLLILAHKNLYLQEKMSCLSKRTTKDKLLTYLEGECIRQKKNQITIPLNRQQLADYLCVERSAMSRELAKLKDEGLLDYHKNTFKLL